MISKYVIQSKHQQVSAAVDTPRQAVSFIKSTFGALRNFNPADIKDDCNVSYRHEEDLANVVTVRQVTGSVNINQLISIYIYPAWLKINDTTPTEESVYMLKDPTVITKPFATTYDIFHYHATLLFLLKRAKKPYTCKLKTHLVIPYYTEELSKDKALLDVFRRDLSLPYGESILRDLIYPLLSKTDPMKVVRL